MRPFRSLSARLTVRSLLLFAAAGVAVSAALSTFIAGSASREVEGNAVERSGLRSLVAAAAHELQNAAQLLARDFGFRAAVASGDQATMQSALAMPARLRVRSAFIISADGKVSTIDHSVGAAERGNVGTARRWAADRRLGARWPAPARRRADSGADPARLGRLCRRSRQARDEGSGTSLGNPAARQSWSMRMAVGPRRRGA